MEAVQVEGVPAISLSYVATDIASRGNLLATVKSELGPLTTPFSYAGIGAMNRDDPPDVVEESCGQFLEVNAKAEAPYSTGPRKMPAGA